ncbi:uncharacterized protein LOC129588071 [Paramacrobiotus metropolitanus]|uniref:uncharacterized protein LOC129588071 n=1 Tax=Paramacrobiotus metropolitanus TaxID=2943436 RepID=UPI0024460300|nr:uncharacterized protein LOC129588071 [Paramacrobiotus metropolitanus]
MESVVNNPDFESPRKLSVPRKFSGPPLVLQNPNKDEFSNKVEAVPEGIVKGFGGAFEKTIAALALDAGRSRGSTPLKTPTNGLSTPEKNANPISEKAVNPAAGAALQEVIVDSALTRKWFVMAAKDDTCSIKRMAREEPRLVFLRDIGNGYTALHWAAHHGNVEIVRFLVDAYHANVGAKSRAGYTPLHIAYMRQHKDLVKALLEHCKADPGEFDYSGKIPEQYADRNRHRAQKAQARPVVTRKATTLSTAISSSMRRVGSFNAKIRSSVMRRMGKGHLSHSSIRPSASFPDRVVEDQEAGFDPDFALMPPPSTVRGLKHKKRPGSDLMRRGSVNSDVSRSDSVISIDEGSGTTGKPFDSGSDSVSFHESESYDSFVSGNDSAATTPVGKHSSPLVYTKSLNSPDGGSQV